MDFTRTPMLMRSLGKTSSADCLLFLPVHMASFGFDFEFTTCLMKADTRVQNWQAVYLSNASPVFSWRGFFGFLVWRFNWKSSQTDESSASQCGYCQHLLLANLMPLRYHKVANLAVWH